MTGPGSTSARSRLCNGPRAGRAWSYSWYCALTPLLTVLSMSMVITTAVRSTSSSVEAIISSTRVMPGVVPTGAAVERHPGGEASDATASCRGWVPVLMTTSPPPAGGGRS